MHGDLTIGRSGSWRGNRGARPIAELYRHRDGAGEFIGLTPYIVSLTSSKQLAAPAGSFSLTLKGCRILSSSGTHPAVDWLEEIDDDDWIRYGWEIGGTQWFGSIGLVDSITENTRSQDGATSTEYVVSGRDVGKCLADTPLLDLPMAGFDPSAAQASYIGALDKVFRTLQGTSPGSVVSALFRYLMRADEHRVPGRQLWAVPPGFDAVAPAGAAPAGQQQVSDYVGLDHVDLLLEGSLSAVGGLLAAPGAGGQAWDLMQAHANTLLNELFVDVLPPVARRNDPTAYASSGSSFDLLPRLVHREKPFPAVEASTPGRTPIRYPLVSWLNLPTTTIDIRDIETLNVGKGGAERFNYFLVSGAGGGFVDPFVLALAGAAGALATGNMLDGVPAVDLDSIQIHGLKKLEQASIYVNAKGADLDVYVGWTKLARDWYRLGHRYRSGTAGLGFLLPGIRIGERLVIARPGRVEESYYVEGVEHGSQIGAGGSFRSRTTLSLTRGTVGDPVAMLYEDDARSRAASVISRTRAAITPGADQANAVADEALREIDLL